jgi:hypothetical protein
MREGMVLRFRCRTTSPFHTSRQEYANLVKCAPFILGSTLRGAVLKRLIERQDCPHLKELAETKDRMAIEAIHRTCALDCPVKPFFAESPLAWFSFGQFEGEEHEHYRFSTRIALARDAASVAHGAIVTIEAIRPGVPFAFSVTLLDEAQEMIDVVEEAVRLSGEIEGIGRLRSIGFGQFAVEEVQHIPLTEALAQVQAEWARMPIEPSLTLMLATPYLLSKGEERIPSFEYTALARRLEADMSHALETVRYDAVAVPRLQGAECVLRPEYISRFSYELGTREHYLVAWEGSRFTLHFDRLGPEVSICLAVASLVGLGPESDLGYGRFGAA